MLYVNPYKSENITSGMNNKKLSIIKLINFGSLSTNELVTIYNTKPPTEAKIATFVLKYFFSDILFFDNHINADNSS